MEPVKHGIDKWSLFSYEWDEDTGDAHLLYERWVGGKRQEQYVVKPHTLYFTPEHLRYVHPYDRNSRGLAN